ncbi:glycosyltransferase family 2 protein, partial [Escherichia coli]|nr:glycosyltransferase family 2 protein [Escherichia coli]
MNDLDVSAVILNYNSITDTINCLVSLSQQTLKPREIVVVDNKSTDSSINVLWEWVKNNAVIINEEYGSIKHSNVDCKVSLFVFEKIDIYFIKSPVNGGYAFGNNLGANYICKYGESKLILLANPDVLFSTDSIEKLRNEYISVQKKDKQVKIIGVQLVYLDDPEKIQAIGGSFNKLWGVCKHVGRQQNVSDLDFIKESVRVDYPIGACLLIESECFIELGGLNEAYFLYYEELDLITRAAKKKIKFTITNSTTIYHKEGGSIGSSSKSFDAVSSISDKYLLQSRLLFIKRYYPQYLFTNLMVHIFYILKRLWVRDFVKTWNAIRALKVLVK